MQPLCSRSPEAPAVDSEAAHAPGPLSCTGGLRGCRRALHASPTQERSVLPAFRGTQGQLGEADLWAPGVLRRRSHGSHSSWHLGGACHSSRSSSCYPGCSAPPPVFASHLSRSAYPLPILFLDRTSQEARKSHAGKFWCFAFVQFSFTPQTCLTRTLAALPVDFSGSSRSPALGPGVGREPTPRPRPSSFPPGQPSGLRQAPPPSLRPFLTTPRKQAGLDLSSPRSLCPPHPPRSQVSQTKEEEPQQRGQAATHSLHGGAAAEAQGRVPEQQVPDGAAAPEPGTGAQPQRVADQDLVPEQARQDQESHGYQERPGASPHGAGTVQPLDHHGSGQRRERVAAAGWGRAVRPQCPRLLPAPPLRPRRPRAGRKDRREGGRERQGRE